MDSTDRELIIDKGRAGETGACTLGFTGQYLTFQERE
jgi:replicative DNA helicase